ncbi:MAG: transglutaminase domain-containing protein [Pirellulales bacterium]|nr:transglutaminase domain-containing protein [Pirellulales bacterium]
MRQTELLCAGGRSVALAGAILALAGCAAGCSGRAASTESESAPNQQAGVLANRDWWDAFYMGDARVGYTHTTTRTTMWHGRPAIELAVENRLVLERFGQKTTQEVTTTAHETPAGQLLDLRNETRVAQAPIVLTAKVVGSELRVETTASGQARQTAIPWSTDIGGLMAVERSLLEKPLRPGEKRSVRLVMPMLDQVVLATNHLEAGDYETTEMPSGPVELLRVTSRVELPGGGITSTIWLNRQGETLKTRIDALGMQSFRTTKEVALGKPEAASFDLGYDTVVRLARPLENPRAGRLARYRVTLKQGDPAAVFPHGPTQEVHAEDAHTALLTVRAVRPGEPVKASADAAPTAADREPNSLIQSDNARVTELAREAVGDETDPVKVAIALERFVHERIRKKNFSQALATAAEVAKNLEGDCTEHAVLLAALARAKGIPARVAIGLVYIPSEQGFGYHMWNELYLDGAWIPMDATIGRGGIGADHLKLAQSNLQAAGALTCFLPVAKVMGQLGIELIESE